MVKANNAVKGASTRDGIIHCHMRDDSHIRVETPDDPFAIGFGDVDLNELGLQAYNFLDIHGGVVSNENLIEIPANKNEYELLSELGPVTSSLTFNQHDHNYQNVSYITDIHDHTYSHNLNCQTKFEPDKRTCEYVYDSASSHYMYWFQYIVQHNYSKKDALPLSQEHSDE